MRRAVVAWVVAFAILAGVAVGGVLVLNATAFGPAAFVRIYLDAVARGDATGALGMPGVTAETGNRTDFLSDNALPGLTDLREVSVEAGDDGIHLVTYEWRSGDAEGTSTFAVEQIGSRLGLFPEWGFATSPVATLMLSVEHDPRFELNGIAAETSVDSAAPVGYAVLVPGVYRIDHHSAYLEAEAVDAVAARPGSLVGATLDVQPAPGFAEQLTTEVHRLLEECATQEVLFPTGCPFGRAISNRVVSPPEWSIIAYPDITVVPGPEFGTWLVPDTPMTAHLRVEVQSLFDGSLSTLDDNIAASVSFLVTIGADDSTLLITSVSPD